jgi:predicted RNA binding protein YcfA (HicA-like mRNA interferase family)
MPIDWKDFERVLLKAGCHFERQVGDHRIYKRDNLKRPIVIPADNPLPVFIIRNNIRTLGLSREEYFKFLAEH